MDGWDEWISINIFWFSLIQFRKKTGETTGRSKFLNNFEYL